MGTQPRNPLERVQFYEDHLAPFTTNMTVIGLVTGDLTTLTDRTEAARLAYNEQQASISATKAKTAAFTNAVKSLTSFGDGVLNKIRAQATNTGNPDVYTLAEIPAPATPTPAGAPGAPFDFKAILDTDGSLKLKWKNSNGGNCVYWIYRALNGGTSFETLGGVGQKMFTDVTVPANSTQILYRVQAVRSTGTSPWANFTVFLTGGTGSMLVKEGQSLKVAA